MTIQGQLNKLLTDFGNPPAWASGSMREQVLNSPSILYSGVCN